MLKAFPPWSCRICTSCSAVAVMPCNQCAIVPRMCPDPTALCSSSLPAQAAVSAMHQAQMHANLPWLSIGMTTDMDSVPIHLSCSKAGIWVFDSV